MKINEKIIVKKVIQKEHDAFETFYHQYVELVHFVISMYIKDKERMDELTKKIFIHLLDQMILFDSSSETLKLWIATLTKNYCLNYLKENKHFDVQATEGETCLFLKEDVKLILNPLEYQVLFLKFESKMSYKEIANFLNITLDTSKKTYQNVIQRINQYK